MNLAAAAAAAAAALSVTCIFVHTQTQMRSSFAVVLLAGAALAQTFPSGTGSVSWVGNAFSYRAGVMDPTATAWANFTDATLHPSDFGHLFVHSNDSFSPEAQVRGGTGSVGPDRGRVGPE
jgi:hypothetical protein